MRPIPRTINDANVVCFTPIDRRHRPTGACRHTVDGVPQPPFAALAVCRYGDDGGYYLLYCDEEWNAVTDTWHATVEDAIAQAEFEFEGTSATWEQREG